MTNIVFLVLWLSLPIDQPPAFQVLAVADSMNTCEEGKKRLENISEAAKGHLSCMQILTPLKDAGTSF